MSDRVLAKVARAIDIVCILLCTAGIALVFVVYFMPGTVPYSVVIGTDRYETSWIGTTLWCTGGVVGWLAGSVIDRHVKFVFVLLAIPISLFALAILSVSH